MSKQQVKAAPIAEPDVGDEAPRRAVSFGRFALEVVLVGALLAGGIYLYRNHVINKQEKAQLLSQARDYMKKNDLASLANAEGLYRRTLEIDSDDPRAISALAELKFWQSVYGLNTLGEAEQFLNEAQDLGAERADRFAAEAYVAISKGKAAEAEKGIRDLLARDLAAPKLAHALGWALMEQGKYIEANRVIRQAQDADFSNIALRITLAEIAQRQGSERAAITQLRDIIKDSMNPNHTWAKGWLAALLAKTYGNLAEPAKHIQELQETMKKAEEDKSKPLVGPRDRAMLAWAEGELALAMGNAVGAQEKADAGLKELPKFPPLTELKARALLAMNKADEGLAAYQEAADDNYRGIKLALAKVKSLRRDDAALAIIDEVEKTSPENKGPEFEIFRGEHYLRKGKIEDAKAAFTRAAELGDDAAILFGLAKVTFEEEKKKGNKADLDRVSEAFQTTLEKRPVYPDAHEFVAAINLWNFQVEPADESFRTAEGQFKKVNVPIGEMLAFYDRVIDTYGDIKSPKDAKAKAAKLSGEWSAKKKEYMANVLTR